MSLIINLTVLIPLDEVRQGWSSKQYPHQVKTMSSYLGIFDHMFDGRSFRPTVVMNVDYWDGDSVHYGNFLQPVKVNHLAIFFNALTIWLINTSTLTALKIKTILYRLHANQKCHLITRMIL